MRSMKKVLFSTVAMSALMLMATSCADDQTSDLKAGAESTVTITASCLATWAPVHLPTAQKPPSCTMPSMRKALRQDLQSAKKPTALRDNSRVQPQ